MLRSCIDLPDPDVPFHEPMRELPPQPALPDRDLHLLLRSSIETELVTPVAL